MYIDIDQIPDSALLLLNEIVSIPERKANPAKNVKPRPAKRGIFPGGRSTFLAGVKDGRYPQPVKISSRLNAWKGSDIKALVASLANQGGEKS